MKAKQINDDNTLSYLFKKVEAKVEAGLQSLKDSLIALINGKVSKSGDTMTGDLTIKRTEASPNLWLSRTDADSSAASNSATKYWTLGFGDYLNRFLGWMETSFSTSGKVSTGVGARKVVNGANADNYLALQVDASGNRSVALSHPNAWMEALSTSNCSSTSTASQIIVPASGITITNCWYMQWGRIAQLYLDWKSSSAVTVISDGNASNVTVGTVVAGKRPRVIGVGTSYGDNAGPAFYCLGSDGILQLGACGGTGATRTIAAGNAFQCSMTYILP